MADEGLQELLGKLLPRAHGMAAQLQGALTQVTAFQEFSAQFSQTTHQNAATLTQQTDAIGKRFGDLDASLTSQRDRVSAKLAQSSSQMGDVKTLISQHAQELEQERTLNSQSTAHLLERIANFSKAVQTAGSEQLAVVNQGMQSVRSAEQKLLDAHTAVHSELTATSDAVVAAAKTAEASLDSLRLGLLRATGSIQSSSEEFTSRSQAASAGLHTQLERVHQQTVQPSVVLRSNQYKSAVYRLQSDTTAATMAVDSALVKHASTGAIAATTLETDYNANKAKVLTDLPATDRVLADQAAKVEKIATELDKAPPPPAVDNRNLFQKMGDAISGAFHETIEFIGATWTNVSNWVIGHGQEVVVGVAVAAATAGAIIFSGGVAIPFIVAAAATTGLGAGLITRDLHLNPDALMYEGSRLIHYLGTPEGMMNTFIGIASIATGSPWFLVLAAVPFVAKMVDPKLAKTGQELPEDYTTGKSSSELTHAIEMARLTRRIYWQDGKEYDGVTWHSDSKDNVITDNFKYLNTIENDKNSFKAEVWQKPDGNIALVFRGSATAQNWVENLAQGLGIEASLTDSIYLQAVQTAKDIQQRYPGQTVELVGDSLGGALAQLASAATGLTATTFNAAATNPITYGAVGKRREDVVGTNYDVAGQALGTFQDSLADNTFPTAIGLGLTPIAGFASDSKVSGTNVPLAPRTADGSDLNMNSGQLHLWDAVEQSLRYELNQALKREGAAPIGGADSVPDEKAPTKPKPPEPAPS